MGILLHEGIRMPVGYGDQNRTHLPMDELSYATLGTRQVQVNGILCLVVIGHTLRFQFWHVLPLIIRISLQSLYMSP